MARRDLDAARQHLLTARRFVDASGGGESAQSGGEEDADVLHPDWLDYFDARIAEEDGECGSAITTYTQLFEVAFQIGRSSRTPPPALIAARALACAIALDEPTLTDDWIRSAEQATAFGPSRSDLSRVRRWQAAAAVYLGGTEAADHFLWQATIHAEGTIRGTVMVSLGVARLLAARGEREEALAVLGEASARAVGFTSPVEKVRRAIG